MLKKSVSKDQILSKINTFHIFKRYAPPFEVGKLFRGDIGRIKRERAGSANIIYVNGKWIYRDFGVGTFSAFDYVMAKFHLTFFEALEKIDEDFGLGFSYNKSIKRSEIAYDYKSIVMPQEVHKDRRIIQIKSSEWSQEDIIYWWNAGWSIEMLNAARIRPISSFFIKSGNEDLTRFDARNELAYSFEYYKDEDNIFQRKIYRPTRTSYGKWFSNVNKNTVQNWHLLPKTGDICFIVSGYKDGGPIWRVKNSPDFIASNNEGSFIPDKVFYKLKQRYKLIVLFWDNDDPGIINAQKYSKKYNIPYIYLPIGGPKDNAAWWGECGGNSFNYYLNRELTKINRNDWI